MSYQNVLEMRFLVNVFDGLSTSRSLIITRLYKLYVLKTALNTTN